MPTCDFFSSANHYQSHVQTLGKKSFLEFLCDSVQIKAQMELILQENESMRRKQHKVHFSVHVLVVSGQDTRIHLFTFPFSRMGLGFAICADCGTIYLYFFSV